VTHEELRALLPAYAAGALDGFASDAVRAHLATGCAACLAEVYARPVGLPRTNAGSPPVVPAPPPPAVDRRGGLVAAVVALALGLTAAVAWIIVELRGREASSRTETARIEERLAGVVAARADLAARVEALARDVAGAEATASRATEAARAARDESARLRDELAAAQARIDALRGGIHRRENELARLRLGANGRSGSMLDTPGAELLPLRAIAPFRDGRGHVLWSPADGGVAWVFGLPPASYRVRVVLNDDRELLGPAFRVDTAGGAVVALPTDTTRLRPQAVEIVLDPAGRRILGWERRAPAGD
jgi:hypothetical protein